MTVNRESSRFKKVLVSDFDGTMTRYDFYKLAVERLIPEATPDYWAQYRAQQITHFEALRLYFASIRASEAEVLQVLSCMELDAKLPQALEALYSAGWRVVVASAGCSWYMSKMLANVHVDLEVHANPGHFVPGEGLLMELPKRSRYFSPTLGVDKSSVVQDFLNQGLTVAFAGDGFPDAEPARLILVDERRFARCDLASVLHAEGLPYQPFDTWADIAANLNESGL